MAKPEFKIIYDLGPLNEAQRQQYLRDASVFFKLDPDLNAFDIIWMNADDGLRRLVVYARKGTTDLLRDIHGIEVSSLVQHDGPGYVSFMATGKNFKGRQEIAVGAHSIEGLKGEKLAAAVMTAQTRALRRLTLQFVGGGILDVSEVNAPTADIAISPASVALLAGSSMVLPPPQVAPSAAPGRDITPTPAEFVAAGIPVHGPISLVTSIPTIISEPTTPLGATFEQQPEAKKKRTYKKRNQVTIASPGQEAPAPGVLTRLAGLESSTPTHGDLQGCATAASPLQTLPLGPPTPPVEPPPQVSAERVASSAEPTPPAPSGGVTISKEKQEAYRARLAKYYVDVLPKGGMLPSEGIGGVTMKMRKFAAVFSGVKEVKEMTEQNWEDLFEFLDASSDPVALVKYINKALGVE